MCHCVAVFLIVSARHRHPRLQSYFTGSGLYDTALYRTERVCTINRVHVRGGPRLAPRLPEPRDKTGLRLSPHLAPCTCTATGPGRERGMPLQCRLFRDRWDKGQTRHGGRNGAGLARLRGVSTVAPRTAGRPRWWVPHKCRLRPVAGRADLADGSSLCRTARAGGRDVARRSYAIANSSQSSRRRTRALRHLSRPFRSPEEGAFQGAE